MSDELDQLWMKYLAENLTTMEDERLAELAATNPALARTIANDRSIDQLLREHFHPQTGNDFVASCVARFEREIGSPSQPITPETTTPESSLIGNLIVEKPSVTTSRKVKRERRLYLQLATVACLLIISALVAYNWHSFSTLPEQRLAAEQGSSGQRTGQKEIGVADRPILEMTDDRSTVRESPGTEAESSPPVVAERLGTDDGEDSISGTDENLIGSEAALAAGSSSPDPIRESGSEATVDPANESLSVNDEGFRLVADDSAKWVNNVKPLAGVGSYHLLNGKAELFFPDGSRLRMIGPVELGVSNLLGIDATEEQEKASKLARFKIDVSSGELELQLAGNGSPTVVLPLLNVRSDNTAVVQMRAGTDGTTEVLLKKGAAEIDQQLGGQSQGLSLRSDKLRQVFAQRLEDAPRKVQDLNPTLLLARGDADFEGRIALGEHAARVNNPQQMDLLLGRLMDPASEDQFDFEKQWEDFALRTFQNGQPFNLGPPGLRDSFAKEFQRMLRGQRNLPLPEKKRDSRQDRATQFQGQLNINGRTYRFSDPQKFFKAFGGQ